MPLNPNLILPLPYDVPILRILLFLLLSFTISFPPFQIHPYVLILLMSILLIQISVILLYRPPDVQRTRTNAAIILDLLLILHPIFMLPNSYLIIILLLLLLIPVIFLLIRTLSPTTPIPIDFNLTMLILYAFLFVLLLTNSSLLILFLSLIHVLILMSNLLLLIMHLHPS